MTYFPKSFATCHARRLAITEGFEGEGRELRVRARGGGEPHGHCRALSRTRNDEELPLDLPRPLGHIRQTVADELRFPVHIEAASVVDHLQCDRLRFRLAQTDQHSRSLRVLRGVCERLLGDMQELAGLVVEQLRRRLGFHAQICIDQRVGLELLDQDMQRLLDILGPDLGGLKIQNVRSQVAYDLIEALDGLIEALPGFRNLFSHGQPCVIQGKPDGIDRLNDAIV